MDNELDPEDIKRLLDESAAQDDTPANDDTDPRVKNDEESKDEAAQALKASLADLADYRRALEEEFAQVTSSTEDLSTKALDSIVKLVPDAGEAISYLLNHANSEGVRAGLARWVFDKVIKKAERDGDEDELTKLIGQLTNGKSANE